VPSCLGDPGDSNYERGRRGNALVDRGFQGAQAILLL
jgi:aminopeptidase-like protein